MCIFACGWRHDLGPQVQQAVVSGLIGGTFTVLTATLGVLIVVYQLKRQAVNTIAANKHNEAMKLKKEVYETIANKCSDVLVATSKARVLIWNCRSEYMLLPANSADRALKFVEQKRPEIVNLAGAAATKAHEIGILVKRWRIIDARVSIFETAMDSVLHEVVGFLNELEGQGIVGSKDVDAFMTSIEGLDDRLGIAERYLLDLETEMQNALLGDLFSTPLLTRVGEGPHDKVITLDKHRELKRYFENETPWGRDTKGE